MSDPSDCLSAAFQCRDRVERELRANGMERAYTATPEQETPRPRRRTLGCTTRAGRGAPDLYSPR